MQNYKIEAMYSYTETLSLLFLFLGFVFSLYNLFLYKKIGLKTELDRAVHFLNCFLLFHTLYVLVVRIVFNHYLFVDYGVPFSLVYGPLFLFIVKSGVYQKDVFRLKYSGIYFHFIPTILFTTLFLVLILAQSELDQYIEIYVKVLYTFSGLHILIYSLLSLYLVIRSERLELKKKTKSLLFDGLMVLIVAGIFLGSVTQDEKGVENETSVSFVSHFLMCTIVIFIHRIWIRELLSSSNNKNTEDSSHFNGKENGTLEFVPVSEKPKKYVRSKQEENMLKKYAKHIENLPEDFFKNTELTMELLASELKINPHYLSQTFSLVLHTNYNQYVNHRRVAIATEIMKTNNTMSIDDIAFLSGFSSKSSFYRAFKEYHNMPPTKFRKKHVRLQEGDS